RKARARDSVHALKNLAERVNDGYRIVSNAPTIVPARDMTEMYGVPSDRVEDLVIARFRGYKATLAFERRQLLDRFQIIDVARRVVGVGSVGTRAYIVLLQGRDQEDPLFLQVKEATSSVLEDHLPRSRFRRHGERVVTGQRLMQAVSDIFLGWCAGEDG